MPPWTSSPRFLRPLALVSAVLAAAIGVYWYAKDPGVGSFQVGGWLTAPLLIISLIWLHRRLPMWFQWTLSVSIAAVGPIGYLVWGGSQWWNWGQLTLIPLVLLVVAPSFREEDDDADSEPPPPWYGGYADGPWGPP